MIPTLSLQFPNVKVNTSDFLHEHQETVPVSAASWAYMADGEWLMQNSSTGKYGIPGVGGNGDVDLADVRLVMTLAKTSEFPRQTLPLDVRNMSANAQEGHMVVYAGHAPVEIDSKLYDDEAAWNTLGVDVYVVTYVDSDSRVRCILSTATTGAEGSTGKKVGTLVRSPAQNNGFVRVVLNSL